MSSQAYPASLQTVVDLFHRRYQPSWADSWDKVGLVCGDPDQPVRRAHLAIDPTEAVVAEAIQRDAQLLIVHHPLLLTPVSSIAANTPKGRVLHTLVRHGIGLLTAHTNADTPSLGVNEAIAAALGVHEPRILEPTHREGFEKLVVFAPEAEADAVRTALAQAGAGHLGAYDCCSFSTRGEGRFRPLGGATPAIGLVGALEVVPEVRVEVIYPRAERDAVLEAMRQSHPYEEVAYDVLTLAEPTPSAVRGHGRIGMLPTPLRLADYAGQVAQALPTTAHGVRVSGNPDRMVRKVAVGAGSGDGLLDLVAQTDADVYVTSDLRHHRAAEFVEATGKALIDVAHWAAEWTWLPVAKRVLQADAEAAGFELDVSVSMLVTDPWSFRAE